MLAPHEKADVLTLVALDRFLLWETILTQTPNNDVIRAMRDEYLVTLRKRRSIAKGLHTKFIQQLCRKEMPS